MTAEVDVDGAGGPVADEMESDVEVGGVVKLAVATSCGEEVVEFDAQGRCVSVVDDVVSVDQDEEAAVERDEKCAVADGLGEAKGGEIISESPGENHGAVVLALQLVEKKPQQ